MEEIDKALRAKRAAQKCFLSLYEDLYKDDNIIPFNLLYELPMHTPTSIGEGVKAEMIERKKDRLTFDCSFEPFGKLEMHKHDCIEIVEIVTGKLRDLISEDEILPGDAYIIPSMTSHRIIAEELPCKARIIFKDLD